MCTPYANVTTDYIVTELFFISLTTQVNGNGDNQFTQEEKLIDLPMNLWPNGRSIDGGDCSLDRFIARNK